MNIYPFIALYPDLSLIKSTDAFFSNVKNKFSEFRNNGFYLELNTPCLYVYEMQSPNGTFKGLLVANDLEDIKSLNIKPHEKTLPAKEQNMIEFTLERKAFIKPLLVGYDPVPVVDDLINASIADPPFLMFELEEAREKHIIWKIEDKESISAIQNAFELHVTDAYIADGHHRCSTALLINENKALIQHLEQPIRMLTLYLPFGDLRIYDYNRIIRLKENTSKVEFLVQLSKLAKLKPYKNKSKPKKKFEFHLYLDGGWYKCKWKSKVLKKYHTFSPILDIAIFNQEMVKSILQYEDFEMDYLVEYVSGTIAIDEFEQKVNKEGHAFGVYLFPVGIEELKAISDHDEIFPPKSTWFEPRVINGIINLELK